MQRKTTFLPEIPATVLSIYGESRCLAFLLLLCILCPWQISLINHYNSIPQTLRVLHNTAFHAANQLEFTQGKNPCSSPWWFVIFLYPKSVWNPHNTLYEHWTYRIRDLKGTLEIIEFNSKYKMSLGHLILQMGTLRSPEWLSNSPKARASVNALTTPYMCIVL